MFGEWPCGMIAARLILGRDEFMEPYGLLLKANLPVIETSNSPMQGKLINLEQFGTFLQKGVDIKLNFYARDEHKTLFESWREELE